LPGVTLSSPVPVGYTPGMDEHRRTTETSQIDETRFEPGGVPMGLVALMALIVGLGVWQFASLAPNEAEFVSDVVDVAIRGNDVIVYNPTHEIVDVYEVSIQRLSGSYSYTGRNLKPRSIRKISMKRLKKAGGQSLNMDEEGECRVRLQYWRGQEKEEFFRYCRGF
jgi:hypothetical protein